MGRPCLIFLLLLNAGAMGLAGMCLKSSCFSPAPSAALQQMRELVIVYGLTDLCLFTEARYTRHPSVADMHSAFQEHPGALDHFPTGSLIPPPAHLRPVAPSPSLPSTPGKSHEGPDPEHSPTSWDGSRLPDLKPPLAQPGTHKQFLGKVASVKLNQVPGLHYPLFVNHGD